MLTRRHFLRALGLGAAAAAVPAVLVPERRIWQVGVQLERPNLDGLQAHMRRVWSQERIEAAMGEDNPFAFMAVKKRTREEMAALYPPMHGVISGDDARKLVGGRNLFFEGVDQCEVYGSYANDWDLLREPVDAPIFRAANNNEPTGTLFGIDAQAYPDWKAAKLSTPEDLRRVLEATPSQRRGIYGRGIVDELRDTQREYDRTLADIARNLNSISDHSLVALESPENSARSGHTRT